MYLAACFFYFSDARKRAIPVHNNVNNNWLFLLVLIAARGRSDPWFFSPQTFLRQCPPACSLIYLLWFAYGSSFHNQIRLCEPRWKKASFFGWRGGGMGAVGLGWRLAEAAERVLDGSERKKGRATVGSALRGVLLLSGYSPETRAMRIETPRMTPQVSRVVVTMLRSRTSRRDDSSSRLMEPVLPQYCW